MIADPSAKLKGTDGKETLTLEDAWNEKYMDWLEKKRLGGPTFKTPPPSIYDVLHPKEVTVAPVAVDLFGIPKLKADGTALAVPPAASEAFTITGADKKEIAKLSGTRITILPDNKKFDIRASDKTPDEMTLTTTDVADPLKMNMILRFGAEKKTMQFKTLLEAAQAHKEDTDVPKEIEGTGVFLKLVKTA